jgi:hypothetical protein
MKTRKELKEEFKQVKYRMGVFQIRNIVSNKIFVGSSTDLTAIWHRHRLQLNFGNHPNEELQNDWKESGEDKFAYEIVSEIKQTEKDDVDYEKEVKLLEEMFIEELQPFGEKGYNKPPKK